MRRLSVAGLVSCVLLLGAVPSGWTPGQPGADVGSVLAEVEAKPLALPDTIAQRVSGSTLLYYFSPTCPHCRETAQSIVKLASDLEGRADVVGVASAASDPKEVSAFVEEFELPFEVVQDTDRALARAAGLRSTPVVLWVEPVAQGYELREIFAPFYRGAEHLVKLRFSRDNPFSSFEPGVYTGRHTCAACHQVESMSWSLTHHSVAYATLYLRNRASDLACVGCHVTGMDQGGFELGDHRSPLSGVTCESCHGPGGPHDGERQDALETCTECHDRDHSLAFTVEAGLPHIDHYFASTLDESEVKARWSQLARGEAERPLAGFAEGKNIGSSVCRDCHKAEWKAWRKSPHAKSMDSLEGEDASRVSCVRCHATPMAAGPEPEALEGFQRSGGVGCESCHGPGETHAASPTADNILGLGSRCPECVIEEVCTSCHDKDWDPKWDLQLRLETVRGYH